MKIKKTFQRRTNKSHHKYFFAESADGVTLWWVYTRDGIITNARKRIYADVREEVIASEAVIFVKDIPDEIKKFIKKEWRK